MEIQHPFQLSHDLGALDEGLGFFPLDDACYHPPSASHAVLSGIRSLVRFGKARAPLAHPVLYPLRYSHEALPK